MAVGSAAGAASLRIGVALSVLSLSMWCAPPARAAAWQPAGIHPASASIADVLASFDTAVGQAVPAYQNRREVWTYVNGAHRLPVAVAVRGDDFRADVTLDGAMYGAGRSGGVRWRSDGNGIAHRTRADLQSDAIDRVPDALFGFRPQDCALAGETEGPQPAWVVADRPDGDRVHWLFIDRASGLLVKSIVREGKVVETTSFDQFATMFGVMRPQHWHVSDGNPVDDIDATVESVTPGIVPPAAVAVPPPSARRVFAPLDPAADRVELPATFQPGGHIAVDVTLDGRNERFVLDTGTASIMLNAGGRDVVLQHARIRTMSVGALRMANVSVLALPFWPELEGILGYDFFFGHVVHIDYRRERVEVLSERAAHAVFADPSVTVVPAGIDQGLPLVAVQIGALTSDAFGIDTGSRNLFVMQPFAQRYAAEIAAHWTPLAKRPEGEEYLEGRIDIVRYRAADFLFGPLHAQSVDVGVEVPSTRPDAIDIPFDGIVGTDILRHFEWWFDYDNERVAMRFTG